MMVSMTRRFVLAAAVLGWAVAPAGRAEAGQVLYASLDNGRIERFDPATGKDLGPFASGLNLPSGLAFDSSGNLFVANSGNNTISEITPGGMVSTFASGLNDPRGLAFDASGNLYVANNGANTISRITSGGIVSTFSGPAPDYANPIGLAFDASGNLYVSSFVFDRIAKITPGGTISIFGPGLGTGVLLSPTGLAFDASGNLYTANSVFNPFISKIAPDGRTVSTLAQGSGLSKPNVTPGPDVGLAFDASGNLYAASFTNYRTINRITPDGTLSSLVSGLSASPQFLAIRDESPATVPEPSTLVQIVSGVALISLAAAWNNRLRAPA
jgi:sugar lactone lactonase YvrE